MSAITTLANQVYGILSITEEQPKKAYNQFKKWAVENGFDLDFRKVDSWNSVLKTISGEVETIETEDEEFEVNEPAVDYD